MTCKDCVHYEMCYLIEHYGADIEENKRCKHFKPKSRFVELPCEVGQKVWFIKKDIVPDDDYRMSFHIEWVMGETYFRLSLINEIGKTVFLSRELAEKALAERKTQ